MKIFRDFPLHLGTEVGTGRPVTQMISERQRPTAFFGQPGSGKSVQVEHQFDQIVRQGHGALLLDSNRLTAQVGLDNAIRVPAVAARVLYLSSQHQESTPMIELLERTATTPLQQLAERETLAKDFTQFLVRTAAEGGPNALLGTPRFVNNATLAFKAVYDANLPWGFFPFLFLGPTPVFDAILARTRDDTVLHHFFKLADMRPEEREKYTESILTRTHELWSCLLMRTLFSHHGDVSVRQLLAQNRVVIADLGPADGNSPEHARLFQSSLINAYFRAAMKRIDDPETPLHPCHLFVEEAATLISPAELELCAQSRKAYLWANYILQGLDQLQRGDHDLTDGLLNHTGTKFVFRLGNDRDAKRLSDILYAAQVDPTRVMEKIRHTSQRLVGHQRLDLQTSARGKTTNPFNFKDQTESFSSRDAVHFLPQHAEHVEETPVFMSTNDQFLEGAAALLSHQTGRFAVQTPSHPKPRLVLGPLPPDPYRCMPGIREKRRTEFLAALFATWPYRDTNYVLRNFQELAMNLRMPVPQLPAPEPDVILPSPDDPDDSPLTI